VPVKGGIQNEIARGIGVPRNEGKMAVWVKWGFKDSRAICPNVEEREKGERRKGRNTWEGGDSCGNKLGGNELCYLPAGGIWGYTMIRNSTTVKSSDNKGWRRER